MENQGDNQEIDIDENIKAAREAATTHSKEWIVKQIWGDGASEVPTQEGQTGDRPSGAARDEVEPQSEAKKRQRNASRGLKKGDKKEAGKLTESGTPGPSKRAKVNNREQISAIVQECLKSMALLLFVKPGVACNTEGSGGTEPKRDMGPRDNQKQGATAARVDMPREQCSSTKRGEEEATSAGTRAPPTQAWGSDTEKNGHRWLSPSVGGLAPEAYKTGSLGRPYMVARAPGLASLIPLAVKKRIWRREFIDIFSLLEIQVEGLGLTTVDEKEKERRERNRVRKEKSFDNWLDAFRIMVCIIVEKFPHCAKDLWLYESKIHEVQRQFTGDAWLDYDKGFRLKMQAYPDMEWDEEDVAGYMHKMMIAREARSWASKGEQPFRGSYHKGRQEKSKTFYKKPQCTQWRGPQTGKGAAAVCFKHEKDECKVFITKLNKVTVKPWAFNLMDDKVIYDNS
ncbi:hypothetical protein NDU88_000919 [Pleurodeles waltl]|uniref:Retrotransposon gag domain-containing protein n=1 Tax=Pleurodeles waltl TaxID=8319 RepID=A0AAV7N9G8_PLEWA|nr:hypothetical protein NDU88_000919 [Pleurodeles waltl]